MRIRKLMRLRDKQRGYLSAALKMILFGGGTHSGANLLLESGDNILLENGIDAILME